MALNPRTSPAPVIPQDDAHDPLAEVSREPWRHGFFMALRRIEAASTGNPRFGEAQRVAEELFRFAQSEDKLLNFHASTIDRFESPTRTSPGRLFVNGFGLLGPNGPMPQHVTSILRNRARHLTDVAALRFLDIFNHRFLSLLYRAFSASMMTHQLDRRTVEPESDTFAPRLSSLVGLSTSTTRHADPLQHRVPLYYSGWFIHSSRPAEGLVALLADFFGVRVDIDEFVGRQVEVPASEVARLGRAPGTPGWRLGNTQGGGAVLGSRVWVCQAAFRLHMGPMDLPTFQRLLPCARGSHRLAEWARLYIGDEFEWEAQLTLRADQVPRVSLGTRTGNGARLGWTTWLPERTARDRTDVRLHPGSWNNLPRHDASPTTPHP